MAGQWRTQLDLTASQPAVQILNPKMSVSAQVVEDSFDEGLGHEGRQVDDRPGRRGRWDAPADGDVLGR